MKVELYGYERFKIFIRRYGLKKNQIVSIIGKNASDKVISNIVNGIKKPDMSDRNALYAFSKKVSMEGKYKLLLNPISWDIMQETELFIGEALYIYRWRRKINVWEFAKKCKCSKVLLCDIEHGRMPSDKVKNNISVATERYILVEHWKENIEAAKEL